MVPMSGTEFGQKTQEGLVLEQRCLTINSGVVFLESNETHKQGSAKAKVGLLSTGAKVTHNKLPELPSKRGVVPRKE